MHESLACRRAGGSSARPSLHAIMSLIMRWRSTSILVVSVMGSSILGEVANASIPRMGLPPRYTHALNWLLTSPQAPASAGCRVATLCCGTERKYLTCREFFRCPGKNGPHRSARKISTQFWRHHLGVRARLGGSYAQVMDVGSEFGCHSSVECCDG